jgi:enoyl-CoA hydratase
MTACSRPCLSRAAVEVTWRGPVAHVLIGDGTRHNVLGSASWTALGTVLSRLAADATVRAVVLSGQGGSFCAGFDMREWDGAGPAEVEAAFRQMEAACAAIEKVPVPVIAKIAGVAAGAGCQLALACDLRVFARGALIGMPIARLGILASPSFAARLWLLAGPGAARDLLYTGRLIGSAEAARLGLVTRIVPESDLGSATDVLTEAITAHPAAAIRAVKRAVGAGLAPVIEAARDATAGPAADYGDFRQGVASFLHSKPPPNAGQPDPYSAEPENRGGPRMSSIAEAQTGRQQ